MIDEKSDINKTVCLKALQFTYWKTLLERYIKNQIKERSKQMNRKSQKAYRL